MDHLHPISQPMEGFSKAIRASLIVHLVALVIAMLLSIQEQKKIFLTPTLSVDLAYDMPTKVSTPVTPVTPKKATPVIDDVKSLHDALKKIKQKMEAKKDSVTLNSKLEELKNKRLKEEKAKEEEEELEALRKIQAQLKVEEMKVKTVLASIKMPEQRGVSKKISKELFELRFKEYYLMVSERITSLWVYGGSEKNLVTIITMEIAPDGKLLKGEIENSSGVKAFDQSAINAVRKAAPFPPLPEEISDSSLSVGLRFCPHGCVTN